MDKAATSDSSPTQSEASPSLPAEIDLSGMTLGDFQVLRRLGRGGMGQVYLAEQISLKRQVALKTLRSDLSANRLALERFNAEAKAVARATHANIVQIYVIDRALVQNQWVHYLALEFIDGRNLAQVLEKKGSADLLMGLSILQQVASALQRASELGIIHRDIKPENILITRQGEVKVADFGLSRCFDQAGQPNNLTQTGVTMGTPLYMAPEQVELRPVDPRTDIYSLGVTCYHMFAGEPPFKGTSPFEIAVQHVQKEAPPLQAIRPDLPAEVCALVQRMMAKKPEDRPQTSREIVREVARLRDMLALAGSGANLAAVGGGDAGVPAAPPLSGPVPLRAPPGRFRRLLLPALSVLLALAVGALASYVYWNNQARQLPTVSEEDSAAGKNASFEKKEKELVALKDSHWPPKKPDDVHHVLDLGIFYLEKGRLDKAEALFTSMKGNTELDDTRRLGMAMVLAFRGFRDASNDKFKEILTRSKKEAPETVGNCWKNYHAWRKMIATALFLNKTDYRDAFPSQLEWWLNAPASKSAS